MLSNILSSFGGTTISMAMLLVKATLILLVALGITLSMQRASAGARHLVWLVTLAALLLAPALTAWAPIPLRILPAATIAPSVAAPSTTPLPDEIKIKDADLTAAPSVVSENVPVSPSVEETSGSRLLDGLSIVVLLWGAVVLMIAASLGYAAMMVRRIVNRARPLTTDDWMVPLWEVSDRLELEEPPRLLRSEDAKMPFACGVFTPTIVLPAEADSWTLERRRAVLLHELAHVRRHDLIGHTLGRLACAVYWFHPLVWTAAKQLRSESERACDDLALSCGARATDYAEHLLDIVTSVKRDATPSVALAMARRKEFEGRMLAILDPDLRHSSPSRNQSVALIASLALIAIVVGAAAPAPRLAQANDVASKGSELVPLNSQNPADATPFPDSRETNGGSSLSYSLSELTSQSTSTQTLMRTSKQGSQKTQRYPGEQPVASAQASAEAQAAARALGEVIGAGIKTGIKTGTTVAQQTLMQVLSGKQVAGKDTDERPTLLARILATDTSASLRRIAAWGLNDYADHQVAAEALARALRTDRDASVREMAAWSLSDAGRSSLAVEALIAALHDSNADVKETAVWSLGNLGDHSSATADALAAVLSDPNPEMRRRAAWALGQIDVRRAPPQLIAGLSDKDPEMRELTAWALFQIEDPGAIPALQSALAREQDKELQVAYIRALAALGEKSVDALKGLLESRDPEIRNIAVRALAGGNATGPWPRPWPQPRPFPN